MFAWWCYFSICCIIFSFSKRHEARLPGKRESARRARFHSAVVSADHSLGHFAQRSEPQRVDLNLEKFEIERENFRKAHFNFAFQLFWLLFQLKLRNGGFLRKTDANVEAKSYFSLQRRRKYRQLATDRLACLLIDGRKLASKV